jgi:hypothetical protein
MLQRDTLEFLDWTSVILAPCRQSLLLPTLGPSALFPSTSREIGPP